MVIWVIRVVRALSARVTPAARGSVMLVVVLRRHGRNRGVIVAHQMIPEYDTGRNPGNERIITVIRVVRVIGSGSGGIGEDIPFPNLFF